MKGFKILYCLFIFMMSTTISFAYDHSKIFKKKPGRLTANQTDALSPVLPGSQLPFQVTIEKAFEMPVGFHSGAVGVYKGLWVFIAGRTNGMHGFGPSNNFPPDA